MSKHNAAKKDCTNDETRCGPQGLADYASANDSADVATIAFIAGGALLLGGIVLYLTAPRATTTSTALSAIASTAQTTLSAQAGVSLDTEAANLVRYPQAFQASGRIIQVAQDTFNTMLAIK